MFWSMNGLAMVDYYQFWIVGGVFLAATACMIGGRMRESIPYGVRRGAQAMLFLAGCGLVVFYAFRDSRSIPWPSWPPSPPAVAAAPPKAGTPSPSPAPKRTAAAPYSSAPMTTTLRTGTIREVTPEEAKRLLAAARAVATKE
jgi:hypothetical protein